MKPKTTKKENLQLNGIPIVPTVHLTRLKKMKNE